MHRKLYLGFSVLPCHKSLVKQASKSSKYYRLTDYNFFRLRSISGTKLVHATLSRSNPQDASTRAMGCLPIIRSTCFSSPPSRQCISGAGETFLAIQRPKPTLLMCKLLHWCLVLAIFSLTLKYTGAAEVPCSQRNTLYVAAMCLTVVDLESYLTVGSGSCGRRVIYNTYSMLFCED